MTKTMSSGVNLKKILALIVLWLVLIFPLAAEQKVSSIIYSQERVFYKLAQLISNKLPRKIEILSYNINLLNGPTEIEKKLNTHLYLILSSQQYA